MLFNFYEYIRKDLEIKKTYLKSAENEIAEKNLVLLQLSSLLNSILLVLFYIITPFIIKGWTITLQHILFLPAALLFFGISTAYAKTGRRDKKVITRACLAFEVVLFAFVISIDVFPYPDAPSSFLPLLFIAFPALFILRFRQMFTVMFLVEVIYVSSVMQVKNKLMAENDIFNSVVAFIFSMTVAHVILKLRAEDHNTRSRYKRLSMLDSLTGIPNKKACENAIAHYLEKNSPSYSALLFLDLDDFKKINDSIGHSAGDRLLEETGKLLFKSFRASDLIGRVGGDEFMILITDYHDTEDALKRKCTALQRALQQIMQNYGIQTSCSIGAILAAGQSLNFHTAYALADKCLYEAKASGKNKMCCANACRGRNGWRGDAGRAVRDGVQTEAYICLECIKRA